MQQVDDPQHELLGQRAIEAELVAHLREQRRVVDVAEPSISAAGSPGIARIIANTSTVTIATEGTAIRIRLNT